MDLNKRIGLFDTFSSSWHCKKQKIFAFKPDVFQMLSHVQQMITSCNEKSTAAPVYFLKILSQNTSTPEHQKIRKSEHCMCSCTPDHAPSVHLQTSFRHYLHPVFPLALSKSYRSSGFWRRGAGRCEHESKDGGKTNSQG